LGGPQAGELWSDHGAGGKTDLTIKPIKVNPTKSNQIRLLKTVMSAGRTPPKALSISDFGSFRWQKSAGVGTIPV
jgi:hypothetical protein